MLLSDIISIPESQLEKWYGSFTKEEQKTFILIEDHPEETNKLLITYAETEKEETISVSSLGLYASTWKDQKAIRIDSWRYKCLQTQFDDSEILLEAKDELRKVMMVIPDEFKEFIDERLYNVILLVKDLDKDVSDLYDINQDYYQELSTLSEEYSPSDESSLAQTP